MTPSRPAPGVITEPLRKGHDRTAFASGAPELDTYLKQYARQDARRNVTAPFVLGDNDSATVVGYYTLAATNLGVHALSAEQAHGLPHYPYLPAILIGRLAVDKSRHGSGLGKFLLVDALRRCVDQLERIGATFVVVEARDQAAASFYEHFGFDHLSDAEGRLFMPMATVKRVVR